MAFTYSIGEIGGDSEYKIRQIVLAATDHRVRTVSSLLRTLDFVPVSDHNSARPVLLQRRVPGLQVWLLEQFIPDGILKIWVYNGGYVAVEAPHCEMVVWNGPIAFRTSLELLIDPVETIAPIR